MTATLASSALTLAGLNCLLPCPQSHLTAVLVEQPDALLFLVSPESRLYFQTIYLGTLCALLVSARPMCLPELLSTWIWLRLIMRH
jgi:hypothetical protein